MDVQCNCGRPAKLVSGDAIYPHRPDLFHLRFWLCKPCDAYVGTHKNSPTHKPLGTLADQYTRNARKRAHAAFDPLWRDGHLSRREAYDELADELGYERGKCHISWMTAREAELVPNAALRIAAAQDSREG